MENDNSSDNELGNNNDRCKQQSCLREEKREPFFSHKIIPKTKRKITITDKKRASIERMREGQIKYLEKKRLLKEQEELEKRTRKTTLREKIKNMSIEELKETNNKLKEKKQKQKQKKNN
jgi:hypothetical protein